MGMYTEFVFGCNLLNNIPNNVIDILEELINNASKPIILPEHDFFKCTRYRHIANSSSFYFGFSESNSVFIKDPLFPRIPYILSIRSSLKNYDNEIDKFVDWIRPYVNTGSGNNDFLGYKIYEADKLPYLFYKDKRIEEYINKNLMFKSLYIFDNY